VGGADVIATSCRLKPVQLKWFFIISTVILLFLAAGLMMTGIHEFQEVRLQPGFAPMLVADVQPTQNLVTGAQMFPL
jgi:hypothetical protein